MHTSTPEQGDAPTYQDVIGPLRTAYDRMVAERDGHETQPWKVDERWRFLAELRKEQRTSLLEVGAGTGVHGKFFQDQGLQVVCTDLSPEMVRRCRARGLEAHVADFLNLDFGDRRFDAAFAMNCLLHVPYQDLGRALAAIAATLVPGALFYLGQYGGIERTGVWHGDYYEPKRYFSYLTDDQIERATRQHFDTVEFRRVPVEGEIDSYFQALTLRRPPP
jgi:SAM-dependent methyltransferase